MRTDVTRAQQLTTESPCSCIKLGSHESGTFAECGQQNTCGAEKKIEDFHNNCHFSNFRKVQIVNFT